MLVDSHMELPRLYKKNVIPYTFHVLSIFFHALAAFVPLTVAIVGLLLYYYQNSASKVVMTSITNELKIIGAILLSHILGTVIVCLYTMTMLIKADFLSSPYSFLVYLPFWIFTGLFITSLVYADRLGAAELFITPAALWTKMILIPFLGAAVLLHGAIMISYSMRGISWFGGLFTPWVPVKIKRKVQ